MYDGLVQCRVLPERRRVQGMCFGDVFVGRHGNVVQAVFDDFHGKQSYVYEVFDNGHMLRL